MALTVVIDDRDVWGSHQVRWGRITFDSSYPTGGEAVAAADFQLAEFKSLVAHSADVATKKVVWDQSASKLMVYIEDGTTGIEAQAANTSDQSGLTFEFQVVGK